MRDWLSARTAATPDDEALIRASSGETWTFAELDAEVADLAGRLSALGVTEGDHLGAVMGARVAYVQLVHAAMRLGATLVPLDDRATARELRGMVETADVTVLVCDADTEDAVAEAAGDVPVASVDPTASAGVRSLPDADPEPVAPAEWDRDDTLALIFTSGTTGDPKAVTLQLRNVLASAVASAFRLGLRRDDRWLVALSLHHTGGVTPVYRMPLYGMSVVLCEEFEAGATADRIETHEATAVSLVPTMLRRMLESRGTLADSLRVVLLGGAPAPEELVERCRNYSVPVFPTYGMTETASQIATATPDEAFERPATVGRPLLWTDLTVVDDGDPVPPGETGEFAVSGPTVTPGYYGNPEATESAFGPHGLRTGDVGYRDENGRVYVLNRRDDRIVTGGENVDPGEVAAVLRDHPAVRDAAVAGVEDPEWGERVSALVVAEGDPPRRGELDAHCRERLADYKVPKTVAFVDSLPRTVSGTVDREAVRRRLREAADEEAATDDGEGEAGADDGGDEVGADDGGDGADADVAPVDGADADAPDAATDVDADDTGATE